jgi:EAL domain-containing protein (putative c-di-GMP-specific phosphodiesterase class I)
MALSYPFELSGTDLLKLGSAAVLASIAAVWAGSFALSINLSGYDLISEHIVDEIIERVKASGVDPRLLEFEVTETAMMPDTRRASKNLQRLAALGHQLALDDFGAGYSNFSYLRTLPINKLKVDRSFMEDLGDPMTERVLHSLVGTARTLGVHCLLEGIETELDLVIAKRVGAQSVQGFLFGRPMTKPELERTLAGHQQAQRPRPRVAASR